MVADKKFFNGFDNSEILDADLDVTIEAEKSGQYIGIGCTIEGMLTVECDRCLGRLDVPVSTFARFSVKYGEEPQEDVVQDDGREVIFISDDNADLDMGQIVYDYACLSLPLQRVHAEGDCDPGTVRYLGIAEDGNKEVQGHFDALKDIFKN